MIKKQSAYLSDLSYRQQQCQRIPSTRIWTAELEASLIGAFLPIPPNLLMRDFMLQLRTAVEHRVPSKGYCNVTLAAISGYHDLVRCFACNLGLRYLTADDDPLSEHIKHCRSDCAYLNELTGEHQDPNCFSDEQAEMSDTEDELEQLEEQNATLRERVTCKVCRERSAIVLLLPCSHLAACVQCGPNLTTCPVCNRRIVETVRTFIG
ncbi:BIR7B-like protein [Mya arenaria]|uniref:BIR7B-like protein n=1 Tax=Mya arenaria TaxID=6604 RepID=A0ABY7ED91_MYAAR|nr:BIR7B-like protein [Mya arenaria]